MVAYFALEIHAVQRKRDLCNMSLFFWVDNIQRINSVQVLLTRRVIWNLFVIFLFFPDLYNAQRCWIEPEPAVPVVLHLVSM